MTEEGVRTPPDTAGMARAERTIRRDSLLALVAVPVAAVLGVLVLPRFFAFPTDLAERISW